MYNIITRVAGGESLLTVSKEFKINSSKFAKMYMEALLNRPINISNILNDPSIVNDPNVRNDVLYMISNDPLNSFDIEQSKECLGKEYEELLIQLLQMKHMCFETESELRSK
eukprot:gene12940-17348_t